MPPCMSLSPFPDRCRTRSPLPFTHKKKRNNPAFHLRIALYCLLSPSSDSRLSCPVFPQACRPLPLPQPFQPVAPVVFFSRSSTSLSHVPALPLPFQANAANLGLSADEVAQNNSNTNCAPTSAPLAYTHSHANDGGDHGNGNGNGHSNRHQPTPQALAGHGHGPPPHAHAHPHQAPHHHTELRHQSTQV